MVWDLEAYSYLDADCPDTVNPSLWPQAQLCAKDGLFEVTDGIYQVRGMDLSNMTIIEGERGVIVIDPLISAETAAASIALYRKNRGDRPVTGVIYTHSHVDHFGGVKGVLPDGTGDVPILAPQGFLEHAVSENVYAGVAMNRRAAYMYGANLAKSPAGQVSTGLGIATSAGSVGLVAPTTDITRTGQEETIDGVRIIFQLTPGTEAPAEMNFYFPAHRALCMAENATHNLHNLLTLRGALVRGPRVWARYLDEAIELYGTDTDVAFASHHWPTWGTEHIVRFLSQQRDLYAYLHDQTLRMLNNGATGPEIAEDIQLPPTLEAAWHTHGYYGRSATTSRPSTSGTWAGSTGTRPPCGSTPRRRPPPGTSKSSAASRPCWTKPSPTPRPVTCGSPPNCSSTPCSPTPATPPPWRRWPPSTSGSATGPRTPPGADTGTDVRLTLSNGALIQTMNPKTRTAADLTLSLTKPQLLGLLAGHGLKGIEQKGEPATLSRLLALLDTPDPAFPIVTP